MSSVYPCMTIPTLNGTAVQVTEDSGGELLIWGTTAMVSTLAGGQSYTIQLQTGDENSQTFVADRASGALSQTVGLSVTLTDTDSWCLRAKVTSYAWAKLVVTGNATPTIVSSRLVT